VFRTTKRKFFKKIFLPVLRIESIHIIHSYEHVYFGQQKGNFFKKYFFLFCRMNRFISYIRTRDCVSDRKSEKSFLQGKDEEIPAKALPRLPKQAGQGCQ